jgi:hypothetical protein
MLAATLTTTYVILGTGGLTYPFTVAFNSSSVDRLVEFSIDEITYFIPEYDVTVSNQLVIVVDASITSMRFTGAIGDTVYLTAMKE